MSDIVDARGLSCPQPVLDTLAALAAKGSGRIEVLVDTEASRENVTRAAQAKDWTVESVAEEAGAYRLAIAKA